jgi:hypothetical protein
VLGPWSLILAFMSVVVMSWEFQWAKRIRSTVLEKLNNRKTSNNKPDD